MQQQAVSFSTRIGERHGRLARLHASLLSWRGITRTQDQGVDPGQEGAQALRFPGGRGREHYSEGPSKELSFHAECARFLDLFPAAPKAAP